MTTTKEWLRKVERDLDRMGYHGKAACPQDPGCDFTWRCATCPHSRAEMAMPYIAVFGSILAAGAVFIWMLTP